MNLEKHIESFKAMAPRNGLFLDAARVLGVPTCDNLAHYLHLVQSQRDVRRQALHRVEAALSDPEMSREDISNFVQFLIEESKQRQLELETKGNIFQLMAESSTDSVAKMCNEALRQWFGYEPDPLTSTVLQRVVDPQHQAEAQQHCEQAVQARNARRKEILDGVLR